ncbi:MAG TPA: hypothetical protein VG275_06980 [Solirubrobacteraceae bacterium]|jgi:hypothetical protein|nr:hypothetical protein [Solirubrobacteraceae bacterium]
MEMTHEHLPHALRARFEHFEERIAQLEEKAGLRSPAETETPAKSAAKAPAKDKAE